MREFSEFEKKIIRSIVSLKQGNIGDFIAENILVNRAIQIDHSKKIISLIYYSDDVKATDDLFDLLSLIDYLEKEMLIFTHYDGSPITGNYLSSKGNELTEKLKSGDDISASITKYNYPTLYDLIYKHINNHFYAISELESLVNCGFETLDQKQLKEAYRQTKHSKYAFYTALTALIFTISYSLFFNSKVELDHTQYDYIIKNIKKGNNENKSNFEFSNQRDILFKATIYSKLDSLITNTKEKVKKK